MTDTIQSLENLKLEDLSKDKYIHMSGIGGSAMNGLAMLLSQKGFLVRGTDPGIDATTRSRLEQHGIAVFTTQDGSTLCSNTQLLVTTAALPHTHPELVTARECAIPVIKYAGMLGVVMNSHRGIAVAGTHGKTTTTALVVSALRAAGLDPGFVIGGFVDQFGAGAFGGKDYFVAEACEYDRSFLNLRPGIALVTNIEADHLDIYSGIDEIINSFSNFAGNITPGGTLLYCNDSPGAVTLAGRFGGKKISYGFEDADYTAENICITNGFSRFSVMRSGHKIAEVPLKLAGKHNVLNALGAFAVGCETGCTPEALVDGIADFVGVRRRFELIGVRNNVHVIDDYAHHPTEIRALLSGAKERFAHARIVVAFQPHQISRTRFFFDDFAGAFALADKVYLPDIYVARDREAPPEITSENLARHIRKNGTDAEYTRDFAATAQRAAAFLKSGDLFLTVGAGNIYEVAHSVLALLG